MTPDTVWHSARTRTRSSCAARVVERVGAFDEALGLGAGTPWSSGEEIDYLVRALRLGVRMEYDPSLVVTHPVKPVTPAELVALGRRDGASVGYVLARNGYPARTVARMLVAPRSRRGRLARAPRRHARAVPRGDARRPASAGCGRAARASAKIAAWRSSQSVSANRSTARARARAA